MSGQRYQVVRGEVVGYAVVDVLATGRRFAVDLFRSHQAADYAARQLNDGMAIVDHHAVVGCRVVASSTTEGRMF